jgi:TetR/AcrR family transcriptional regulator, transcriptional repressor for nem operon
MTPRVSTVKTDGSVRRRDSRETRDVIVAAAGQLMHVHGYHGTSLDDVLRESGVGKGNFYYYFKSKEDLGYAILEKLVDAFIERTLEPCFSENADCPLTQIRCFLGRVLETQRKLNCVGGCQFGNLAAELSDVHEGFRIRLATVFSRWGERLTRALTDAQRSGAVTPACQPAAVAQFVVASLEGSILMTKLTKDITVMEQCVAELGRYLGLYEKTR